MRRMLAVLAAATAAVSVTLVAAPSASAHEVWYQAIGRSSATATCPTNSAADTAAGWTEWSASWQQWPNGGHGGFVCQRSVVWTGEGRSPFSSLLGQHKDNPT